jgi:hypothetical protein
MQNAQSTNNIIPYKINHFVKVPKEVILAKGLPIHRASVFLYLYYNQTREDTVHYSPTYMIQWCRYKPVWDRHSKVNIYTKSRDCMKWLYENEYITNFRQEDFVTTRFQSSKLNLSKMYPSENFGILYDFEIEIINQYHSTHRPITRSMLLLLLSYIRAFTLKRTVNVFGDFEKYKVENPEIFCSCYKDISAFTGIEEHLVSKATNILQQLGLIETYRIPKYKDEEGHWHNNGLIYVSPYKYQVKNNELILCKKEEYSYKDEINNGLALLKAFSRSHSPNL